MVFHGLAADITNIKSYNDPFFKKQIMKGK